tara:strand:- start:357 stop:656 length:300 start_codon:yes stop_codon:yes gene_type:complete
MHFGPRNRHLYVELLRQENENETQILLPDDYKPPSDAYIAARLLDWAPDCNGTYFEDDVVVVRENMIEEVKVGPETFFVVLENHVVGVMEDEYDETEIN